MAGRGGLGVLGGTFDPVHHGHLLLALYAREQLSCSQILLIPNAQSPFKATGPVASFADRLAMLRLAIANVDGLAVSEIEGKRGGISYMIDTLRELSLRHADEELILILGRDAYTDLPDWRETGAIRELAHVAVVARGEGEPLIVSPSDTLLRMPRFDISASEIRQRIRDGEPIDYLTPPAVVDYIRRQRLYQSD